eukprot:g4747.t1
MAVVAQLLSPNRQSLHDPHKPVVIPTTKTDHFHANETARAERGADYEAELAIITSKDCKDVTAANALDCVLGYTAINDVSARWWQFNTNIQWSFSKSFDTHAPIGPVFVHKDELGDASGLHLQLILNGKVVQDANTSDLIFGTKEILEFISMGTTVEARTVIATGTPPGTGLGDVKSGDTMTVRLEKVGDLTNPVVAQGVVERRRRAPDPPAGPPFVPRGRVATRIIRFLDADGIERHGAPADATFKSAELIDGDIFGSRVLTGKHATVAKLLSPVKTTPAIYGVGCNYKGHCPAAINPNPQFPAIFFKNRKSLNDPLAQIEIPRTSTPHFHANETARAECGADYEAELAVITSKDCKDVTADEALDCVLGYTALNDFSARWWQQNDNHQWSFAKSFDTHAPLGPVFVHKDELGDASGLHIQLILNGKVVQDANTSDLIFGTKEILEFISMGTTVEARTVIATGTPPGTGLGDVKVGDTMTVRLEKVGDLTNPVVAQGP